MGRLGGFVPQLSIVRVVIVPASNRNERVSASIGHTENAQWIKERRCKILTTRVGMPLPSETSSSSTTSTTTSTSKPAALESLSTSLATSGDVGGYGGDQDASQLTLPGTPTPPPHESRGGVLAGDDGVLNDIDDASPSPVDNDDDDDDGNDDDDDVDGGGGPAA